MEVKYKRNLEGLQGRKEETLAIENNFIVEGAVAVALTAATGVKEAGTVR